MADVFTLLSGGTLVEKREIVEGLNPTSDFLEYIQRFFPEEIYNLNENSTLYKFLYSLLGDSGVLGIKKALLAPRLYTTLNGTNFNDIDTLFSNLFGLIRAKKELYDYDPYNQLLTEKQWTAIKYKDTAFKTRAQDFMRFFQFGNSYDGIKILSRSASGYECYVQENWKYLDDLQSDDPIGIQNLALTNAFQELIIIPQSEVELSVEEKRRVTETMRRFIPADGLITINNGESLQTEVSFDVDNMNSTSDYFYIDKKVTGKNLLDYSYSSTNNWIEVGEEKSAPYGLFESRSETIETIPVFTVNASSYHTGAFSNTQKYLFEHLNEIEDDKNYSYTAQNSLASSIKNNFVFSPWIFRSSTNIGIYTVDRSYPVGYFANQQNTIQKRFYWASKEGPAELTETLEIDLLTSQPLNNLELEVSQKPIDIKIYYWSEGGLIDEGNEQEINDGWVEVNYRTDIETDLSVYYENTFNYSWQYLNPYFELIQTNKIKIEFYKRNDSFPAPTSESFDWSVEVRNLRVLYSIAAIDDFVSFQSVDVLGNYYRTSLNVYSIENRFKTKKNKYWKSQINPDKFAVEALYFDVSQNGQSVAIDEIFIDPLTPGCVTHFYYSEDDSLTDWDNKLWNPIPRHYVLAKESYQLPNTIYAKYIKIEFSKLAAIPYNFPTTQEKIQYRLFPSWVEQIAKDFASGGNAPTSDANAFAEVSNTFINSGIVTPESDRLTPERSKSILDFIRENVRSTVLDEYQVWKNPERETQRGSQISEVNFYPNAVDNLYHNSLLQTVTSRVSNSKFDTLLASVDPNSWKTENYILPKPLVNVSSKNNRNPIEEEKNWPDMWFMKKCRHAYKIVESPRSGKIGYYVGIKDIKFYKRDKTKTFDDRNYIITLNDESFIEKNEFYANNWRWTLDPDTLVSTGENVIPEFASENFDGVAF